MQTCKCGGAACKSAKVFLIRGRGRGWGRGWPILSGLEVGLTTLGQPRLSEGAQPYPLQRVSAQGGTGDRMIGWGHTLSGFGSRPAGIRYGLSGLGSDPGPAPEPEDLNQGPEGRDLGPEMPLAWPTGQLINRSTSGAHPTPTPTPTPIILSSPSPPPWEE